uniref:Uncharacterized protein LOC111112916 isoform X2 n=1 Tax=Crassostrea virginica TaxID=6565 RepID=A0A8B8BT82_CRAVI|nr:uncharacterized protein LOC111112916 isoform X2 [Crassostrea virginica]
MSVVSISIRHGSTVILPWTIIEGYSDGCTFLDLFEGVKSNRFDLGSWIFPEKLQNTKVCVSIGKTKTECDPAIITNKVAVTIPVFGHYIRYSLSNDNESNSCTRMCSTTATSSSDDSVVGDPFDGNSAKRNVNDVLLMGARKLVLPEPYAEDGKIVNNKRLVYNKILYMLGNAGLGFTPMTMNEGKNFINALTNCIWTIDPQLETLRDRSFTVPILFESLFGYNIPENHKHKRDDRYKSLVNCLEKLEMFKPVCVDEYTPQNTRDRRYFLDNMKHGIQHKCVHLKFSSGNNLGSHNFLWRIPNNVSDTDNDLVQKNTDVIQALSKDLPSYHTRAMRRAFINKASLLCNLNASNARYIYKSLAGDCSLAENSTEKEVDLRVQQAFEMEDPDIITDLRQHNTGQPSKYQAFFTYAQQYLENVIETAVDDRRHDRFTHLAQAMSVPDLLQQVKDICPENTPIPSEQWLRLQFAPKNPSSLASLQYTGNLKVKFQVQSRQLRKTHVDNHYASAIFRYMKDFAVKFRDFCVFVAMDDKHHCKVGEPGHPVAAVERGKRVVVGSDKVFAVSDHDFTKFSVVPSVTMLIDIPESVAEGSFYRGQVFVGVKDLALEPSSPLRHITELKDILMGEGIDKPILCMYSDGGPDHRVTYLSVQLSIICLFLSGNYDMIIAARTPPMGSWKNPPERIMSILNLALQAVGLIRKETSSVCEQKLKSASGLSQLRDIAKDPLMRQEMVDSIEPVKTLLSQLFRRLKLKDKQFKLFSAASEADLNDLWGELSKFGNPPDGKRQQDIKKSLKDWIQLPKACGVYGTLLCITEILLYCKEMWCK